MLDVSHCHFVLLGPWLRRQGCEVDATFEYDAAHAAIYTNFARALALDIPQAKDLFMATWYGLPRIANRDALRALLGLYPNTIEACFAYAKNRYAWEDHLATQMQREEGKVMLHGAVAAFMALHPDVPVLTIHDALIVPAPFATDALRSIEDAFRVHCGLVPRVKVLPLHGPAA